MDVTHSHRLLDTRSRATATPSTRALEHRDTSLQRGILCRACRARITDASQRIEVAGQHAHTFFNPAGIVFHVVCYASAPGCAPVGPATDEFSWFAGHRWQILVCAACAEHLGWQFLGASRFAALIDERIVEADG